MGSKVKALIGVGLMLASGGLATGFFGLAVGSVAASVVAGIITLVGVSLSGDYIAEKMDEMGADAYSGVKLQTHKSNVSPLPFLYGVNKIGSNIIWQQTGEQISGSDNKDYWSIQSIAGHDLESGGIVDMFANQDKMVSKGSEKYTLKYTYCKVYYSSESGGNQLDLDDIDFVTLQDGTTQTGSQLGFDNFTLPVNMAFMTIHQVFETEDNAHIQLDSVTAELKGKQIPEITSSGIQSTASYSDNPARIIVDLLQNGLNISNNDIDADSFYQAMIDCTNNKWSCNVAFIQQANVQSIIQTVLASCRGQIVHSGNKWKMKVDTRGRLSAASLNDDDFINNSLSISMIGNSNIANKVILKYINPNDEWLSAQAEISDSDLYNWDGQQSLVKTLDIKACTNKEQAEVLAEIALNSMRYSEDVGGNRLKQTPLVLSFATTVKNADLEVGDVITIDSDLLDRIRNFVILSVETDQSGLIQVSTREYCETHYKSTDGFYLI